MAATPVDVPTPPAPVTPAGEPSEPMAPAGVVINGAQQAATVTAPPQVANGGGKKKWIIPAVATAAVAAILGGGYVFGMYLPNRPETVFSKSLVQTGKAADKLVEYSSKQMQAKYVGSKIDGTLSVKSSGASIDATIKGESDAKNTALTLSADVAGQKMSIDLRMIDSAQSTSPDTYLKLAGVKSFLQQAGGAQLAALDGQWVAMDHTVVDSFKKQLETATGTQANLSETPTPEQINDAIAKVQAVNKAYLFTDDKDKAVLHYKDFVGKETVDGRVLNHYTVGYDKAHLEAYMDAVSKALDESKLNDWSKKQNSGKNLSDLISLKSAKEAVAKNKGTETFDVNVDTATKLIQSVTFTSQDKTTPGTLTIAQNYTSGDSYPFSLRVKTTGKENPSDMTLGLTANMKTNVLDLNLKGASGTNSDTTYTMVAHILPSNDKVTITAPTGAKPVTDVLKQLGVDPGVLGSSTTVPQVAPASNLRTQ
jgi:hypothetical protein